MQCVVSWTGRRGRDYVPSTGGTADTAQINKRCHDCVDALETLVKRGTPEPGKVPGS